MVIIMVKIRVTIVLVMIITPERGGVENKLLDRPFYPYKSNVSQLNGY